MVEVGSDNILLNLGLGGVVLEREKVRGREDTEVGGGGRGVVAVAEALRAI